MNTETFTPPMGGVPVTGTQKLLNLFFVIDVSGSMRAENRIEAVNEAFTRMIPALRDIQMSCNSEFELKIAIQTFDQEARWIVPPISIMEYQHEEIECSKWVTFYSKAFKALGEKLTRDEYMAHSGKLAQPYIMFMTDGEPTEKDDYEPELARLLKNGWFEAAKRFAVLIGPDAINSSSARAAVAKFVTDETEGIINASDAAEIVAAVQANTIHTVNIMTHHDVGGDENPPEGGLGGTNVWPGDVWPGDVWPDLNDMDDFPNDLGVDDKSFL